MRLPQFHMSNGAWIFASAVAMAIIAPVVYAATSVVVIGNANGAATALVTRTHQLQTVTTAPTNVVNAVGVTGPGCETVYTPPSGKAIMVTQVTYDLGTGNAGTEAYGVLTDASSAVRDFADTEQGFESESRTFPTGLAMSGVGICSNIGNSEVIVAVSGYLIPATQLPPEPPQYHGRIKGMARR
jgi:hypothetical protein